MRRSAPTAGIIAVLLALACRYDRMTSVPEEQQNREPPVQAQVTEALALTAEVEFGSDHVGSPFPPAQHDQSFHSFDRLRARAVVIARGGSVSFEIYPCHQPAVYRPGTAPEDIDVTLLEPIGVEGCPPQRINDPEGRLALAPAQSDDEKDWTTPPGTFDEPGTYLVICTTQVHFQFARMYGWVIVK